MRQRKRDNIKRLAVGSSLAAVAGYIAGLLTAPQSGKETREDIADSAIKRRKESEKELKHLNNELGDVINDAKKRGEKVSKKTQAELKDVLEKAVDTKEKVREVLSALHEGDAEDQDLKRAIKNASQALEHLRDFIKK
jgi:gas vesicle protein